MAIVRSAGPLGRVVVLAYVRLLEFLQWWSSWWHRQPPRWRSRPGRTVTSGRVLSAESDGRGSCWHRHRATLLDPSLEGLHLHVWSVVAGPPTPLDERRRPSPAPAQAARSARPRHPRTGLLALGGPTVTDNHRQAGANKDAIIHRIRTGSSPAGSRPRGPATADVCRWARWRLATLTLAGRDTVPWRPNVGASSDAPARGLSLP